MRKVAFVSALSAVVGYAAVHFAFFAKPNVAPAPTPAAVEAPAEPVVLAAVVEVRDPAGLLDAPPPEREGVPFDALVVPAGFAAPAAVPPIPKAAD